LLCLVKLYPTVAQKQPNLLTATLPTNNITRTQHCTLTTLHIYNTL
jgi:hypothetical protein